MSRCYVPAFWIGFNAAALALVASGASLAWLAALLLLAIGLSFDAERLAPYRRDWNRDHADLRLDLIHVGVNEALLVASIASAPIAAALLPWPSIWPSHAPLPAKWLAAVLVADLGITFVHFASHRAEWLWRQHAIHHAAPRLYGMNGLMKHPVHQTLETLGGTAPLVLLGMPTEIAALVGFSVGIQLLLQHTNVDVALGPLRHVLAVGPVHRLHHRRGADGDWNFGLFTTLGDRILGTWADPEHAAVAAQVGVDEPVPRSYVAQLSWPWRSDRP